MASINGVFGICLLLFGGVQVSLAMTVSIPLKEYKVARGDDATLPCTFTLPATSSSAPIVSWTAISPDSDDSIIATYFSASQITISKKYKSRASLEFNIPKGIANLKLSAVTSLDTRSYECKVQDPSDEEGGQSAKTKLTVLVAPSTPLCKVAGVAEYGQNINLTCFSEEGTPTPTYKWQNFDVNNVPRQNPPKTTDQNGILSLYNISKDTSGYFLCTSTNEIRSAKCNITLSVLPPSMNMASTFGIIGAIAAAVLILGIIIFCCCCRKKNKPEEYEMENPEVEEYTDKDPKVVSESHAERVKSEEEYQNADRRDPRDDRSERSYDRRSDYNSDKRDDNSDRRDRYEKDDRYDDRRDRRDRYDDRRDRYDDRRDRYDDRRDRYDSDQYSDRYDSRDRPPSIPPNKPRDPKI
nr:glycoprotein A33 (transmembrane), paralog a [Misgurnus anguillicaudatus]XP_055062311.1 glycoprotein A33 (transmembrane), paralog a [Misgurnus anguillicaudatus]XP_055062312.1 glycoprotein A33 (transmembrane), paralog a [Misgurnus anguillicaudatus]